MRTTLLLISSFVWLSGCDSSETLGDSMVAKRFKLSAEQIRPLAEGHGACFASDMIKVEGRRVAFMYREAPGREGDSGWRFMSVTSRPPTWR